MSGEIEVSVVKLALMSLVGIGGAVIWIAWIKWRKEICGAIERFRAQGPVTKIAVVVFAILAIAIGGTKPSGDGEGVNSPPRMRSAPRMVAPIESDLTSLELPEDFPIVTNLCFWGIAKGEDAVELGLAWPQSMQFVDDMLDIYGNWQLLSNRWTRLMQVDVSGVQSNAIVRVDASDFPTNEMERIAFFRVADETDSDDDGLTDAEERWVYGSDEYDIDSDGDGLKDAEEILIGCNPLITDTDGDGISDGDEVGYAEIFKDNNIEWRNSYSSQNFLENQQEIDSFSTTIELDVPVIINGVSYTSAVVDLDGVVWLIKENGAPTDIVKHLHAEGDVTNTLWSANNVTIAGFCYDLYAKPTASMSASALKYGTTVVSNNIFEFEYFRCPNMQGDSEPIGSCQIMIPHDLTNIIYVTYQRNIFNHETYSISPTIGVQLPNTSLISQRGKYCGVSSSFEEVGNAIYTTFKFHVGTCTSPTNADSDGDGINDFDELYVYHTNPRNNDSDGDGVDDGEEINLGINPNEVDSDSDGLPDGWEITSELNPCVGDDSLDYDNDGLPNIWEYRIGTKANNADTDGDGLTDGEEGAWYEEIQNMSWLTLVGNFVFHNAINNDIDIGAYTNAIPFCGKLAGRDITLAVADVDGTVYFGDESMTNGVNSLSSFPFVAGYASDLLMNSAWDHRSSLRFGASRDNGGNQYSMVVYDAFNSSSKLAGEDFKFQIAIPECEENVAYLQHWDTHDLREDGWVSIGATGVNYTSQSTPFEFKPIHSITTIKFHLGCGTNPLQPDSDGDGMLDGWEAENGFNPIVNNDDDDNADNDWEADPDGDGLTNVQECDWNTDPFETDSDNDGVDDGDEVGQFSDPSDATDRGQPASRVPVTFTFGDHSGSHSEKYRLELTPVAPRNLTVAPSEMPKAVSWVNAEYGECETKTAMLARGFDYKLRMYHAGTSEEDSPDYDYSLVISYPPTIGVIINDPSGLIKADDMTSDYFSGEGKVATITVLDAGIYADYDRDGKIDENDRAKLYAGRKLRHWVNDDEDTGDVNGGGGDIPGAEYGWLEWDGRDPDWSGTNVNGRCDLLDFAPIRLDVSGMLSQLEGSSSDYSFRLSHADGAVKVVWTSLDAGHANSFLTTDLSNCGVSFRQNSRSATTFLVDDEGLALPSDFLNLVRSNPDKGVVLIEGCAETTSPLVFECRRTSDDELVFKVEMPLSISEVGKMFRMKNLRPVCGDNGELAERLGDPENNPDMETNQKNLIFLHGANVTRKEATAWFSEIFKRLWQSGVNIKFHGVTWHSDKGSNANYQENVSNAFVTASSLSSYVNGLSGQRTIMAHSLGNMVVSSAIQDYGMQVYRYLMCNSAVPAEAYDSDPSLRVPQLVHPEWEEYPTNSWASSWHWLFRNEPDDDRKFLGWPGRFADVAQYAVNFYSTGDEVLELAANNHVHTWTGISDTFGHLSWHKQELFKGRGGIGGTSWSGWNIDENLLGVNKISVEEAQTMTESDFRTNTVFYCYPSSMNQLTIPLLVRGAHLAQGIPALTPAMGMFSLDEMLGEDRSFDENQPVGDAGIARPNTWPARSKYNGRWCHSDLKDVAYFYVFKFYEKVIEKGGLR